MLNLEPAPPTEEIDSRFRDVAAIVLELLVNKLVTPLSRLGALAMLEAPVKQIQARELARLDEAARQVN